MHQQPMSHLSPNELNALRPLLTEQARREAQALYERRAALAGKLAGLDREAEESLPQLKAALAAAEERFREVEPFFVAAREALGEASAAYSAQERALMARRSRLQNELAQSAPAEIECLLADLTDGQRRTMDQRVYSRLSPTDQVEFVQGRLRPKTDLHSNRGEIEAQLQAIQLARREAESLKFAATEPDTLAETLNAIKARALAHLATD